MDIKFLKIQLENEIKYLQDKKHSNKKHNYFYSKEYIKCFESIKILRKLILEKRSTLNESKNN